MYITHTPRGGFPRPTARQPRGCLYRTIRLQKALGEMFFNADLFATGNIPTVVERYRAWEIRPGGRGIHHRRVRHLFVSDDKIDAKKILERKNKE